MAGRSQYGPAAGTNQGAETRPWLLNPPEFIVLRRDELLQLRKLKDYTARGLYEFLCEISDFETGEVSRDITYPAMMDQGHPPAPQQGPRRPPTANYNQLRRMLRELEALGLIARDAAFNAAQGRLLINLPYRAAAAAEWKKKQRAQRIRPQELAQGTKPRKPA